MSLAERKDRVFKESEREMGTEIERESVCVCKGKTEEIYRERFKQKR